MPHKLLLADDSVTIQRVIELTFADEDIRVIAVGDGKQAIDRIQAERPDIVLADVGMPERDGYEVAAFVKGHPELANVPVLLLTGAFEPIDERRARAAGCDGVLVKPFEPQMVINRVKDLLAGRRPAGLWAAGQGNQPPAPPARPATTPIDLDLRTESAAGGAAASDAGASLDDYFDRLDAAFADLDAGAPPSPTSVTLPPAQRRTPDEPRGHGGDFTSGDVLADWDPELTGDPARPSKPERVPLAVAPPSPPPPVTAAPAPPPPGPAHFAPPLPPPEPPPDRAGAMLQGLSLADAFAALLAAEQGQPIAPAAIRPADVPESTIEDIVRRVAERMTGESVRGIVLEVAERLVREEIANIRRR